MALRKLGGDEVTTKCLQVAVCLMLRQCIKMWDLIKTLRGPSEWGTRCSKVSQVGEIQGCVYECFRMRETEKNSYRNSRNNWPVLGYRGQRTCDYEGDSGAVLQRAHELHVKTGIRLSRTESVKNIGNNNWVCDQVCSKLNYGLIIINVTIINVFNNCYWLHHWVSLMGIFAI